MRRTSPAHRRSVPPSPAWPSAHPSHLAPELVGDVCPYAVAEMLHHRRHDRVDFVLPRVGLHALDRPQEPLLPLGEEVEELALLGSDRLPADAEDAGALLEPLPQVR